MTRHGPTNQTAEKIEIDGMLYELNSKAMKQWYSTQLSAQSEHNLSLLHLVKNGKAD